MPKEVLLGHFFPKFGLDANVLVDLILYPAAKNYFKQRGYSFPDKFLCTLPQVIGEVKGVLINKYGWPLERTNLEINRIMKEFFIEKLPPCIIDDDISLVEEAGIKYGLNAEDVPIIYCFLKNHVEIVVVRDTAFEMTCKEMNIKIVSWPKF